VRLRLVGVRAEGLVPLVRQHDLYDDTWDRRQRLLQAVDALHDRYGRESILPASLLKKEVAGYGLRVEGWKKKNPQPATRDP
jgi:hypothetical protein